MSTCAFSLSGETLVACASGALVWPERGALIVSDLHLGRTERIAREGGQIIPPYENLDTLERLQAEIEAHSPTTVICLGDSFDDLDATRSLTDQEHARIAQMQEGRDWVWVEGNHDPAPLGLAGRHGETLRLGPLTLRHIADDQCVGEISGHYHPKATIPTRGRGVSRPCFIFDQDRLILPAFGTYTGGMKVTRPPLSTLFGRDAQVIITGKSARKFPLYAGTGTRKRPAASRSG